MNSLAYRITIVFLFVSAAWSSLLQAAGAPTAPQAATRSNHQNYKDMVLAACVARAYKDDPKAGKDAGHSASVYVEWTAYDIERAVEPMNRLIESYLARDYGNPLVEHQGVQFDLLKCVDLYHSKELTAQAKRFAARRR
jgi:hypothetical protein